MPLELDNAVRMARVVVTMEFFKLLFDGNYFRLVKGLPPDAILHQIYFDPATSFINLYYKSEFFAPVRVGDILPEIVLTFETERVKTSQVGVRTSWVGVDYSESSESKGSYPPEHPG